MFSIYSINGSRGLQRECVRVVAESEAAARHDGMKALHSCLPQVHLPIVNVDVIDLGQCDFISPEALRYFVPLAQQSLEEDGIPHAAHAASDGDLDGYVFDAGEGGELDCDGDE